MVTNFMEAKNFFTKLLRKFRGSIFSEDLVELRVDKSIVRIDFRSIVYFSVPNVALTFKVAFALESWHP